jgi:predicted TPR repeat methyltransferase
MQCNAGDVEAAASLYERGLEAIPDCVLLHIAYAELEEKRYSLLSSTTAHDLWRASLTH